MTKSHPTFDRSLAALLPALDGFAPVGMTRERLEHFRNLPLPSIEEQIGDRPVRWRDHVIPGHDGAEIVVR